MAAAVKVKTAEHIIIKGGAIHGFMAENQSLTMPKIHPKRKICTK